MLSAATLLVPHGQHRRRVGEPSWRKERVLPNRPQHDVGDWVDGVGSWTTRAAGRSALGGVHGCQFTKQRAVFLALVVLRVSMGAPCQGAHASEMCNAAAVPIDRCWPNSCARWRRLGTREETPDGGAQRLITLRHIVTPPHQTDPAAWFPGTTTPHLPSRARTKRRNFP